MSIPTTPVSFQKGIAYAGQTRIGDPIQVIFIGTEGDNYIVEYRGKRWKADLRKKGEKHFFQLVDLI